MCSQSPIGAVSVVSSLKTIIRAALHLFHMVLGGFCWTGQCHVLRLALLRSPVLAHSLIVSIWIFTMSNRKNTRRYTRHLLISVKSLLFTSADPVNSSMMVISPILAGCGIQSEFMETDALQACKDSQIAVIQFVLRIAWMYQL
jgi:hypothetical protein